MKFDKCVYGNLDFEILFFYKHKAYEFIETELHFENKHV